MKKTILLFALSTLLLGCSATNGLTNAEKNVRFAEYIETQNVEAQDKITSFRLHGWNALSNQYLTISTFPKKYYLVSLRHKCSNITFAQTLVVYKSLSHSLQSRFDSIASIDSPQLKCFIDSIYKLTPEQYDAIKAIDNTEKNKQENEANSAIEKTLEPLSKT